MQLKKGVLFYLSVCFLVVVFLFKPARRVEVFFSPSLDCEKNIVDNIEKTQETLDIAVYSMTNKSILSALIAAHERGVQIRLLTDKSQIDKNNETRLSGLVDAGLSVKMNRIFKLEHNKFAVYDSRAVSTGSYNWTASASFRNSENCLFIFNDKKTIGRYQDRFNYLWRLNSQDDPEIENKIGKAVVIHDKKAENLFFKIFRTF